MANYWLKYQLTVVGTPFKCQSLHPIWSQNSINMSEYLKISFKYWLLLWMTDFFAGIISCFQLLVIIPAIYRTEPLKIKTSYSPTK